ncbi:dTMP kinase [Ereboglobus luteus]|uniref:Thymidylate kinase n=1 Tax=Ereboglobus luteus TaxID=1796921 RepID=A0A2U8E794_9BACT|nr:dTMP kinase [Ereboglobus luteus]
MLISFEGSEGSGKTTQIARLVKRLEKLGHEIVTTREPGGTKIGEQVRDILLHTTNSSDKMFAETELLLFAAARAQIVREVIAPALLRGAVVLSDRYLDSSTVYQGIARNLGSDPVNEINRFAIGTVMPDVTVVIDVPTKVSIERISKRKGTKPDRIERENIDFYEKVRAGYLVLAKGMPGRFVVVNGTKSAAAIEKEIWSALLKRVFKKKAPKTLPMKKASAKKKAANKK